MNSRKSLERRSPFRSPARTRSARSRDRWARFRILPRFDLLEERRLLTIVDIGLFRFDGDFHATSNPDGWIAKGHTLLGLAPTQGEQFKSLISFDGGSVSLPGPTTDQSEFFAAGQLSLFLLKENGGNTQTIWNNSQGQIFTFDDLARSKQALSPNDGPVAVQVAKVPFIANNLGLEDPTGGSTADARVALQGSIDFSDLPFGISLPGLKLGVFNNNYVYADENGMTLTGVDASYTNSFKCAGVDFKGSIGATYTPSTETYGLTGSIAASTPGGGLSDFTVLINEFTVTGGAVTAVSMTLDGSIKTNSIWGLSIAPKHLTFELDLATSQFKMYGDLSVSVAEDGSSKQVITASLGDSSKPGLQTDFSGHVQEVNMGLSGSFSLFGIGLQIPASNPATLVYHSNTSQYLISGTVSIPKLFKTTVQLGTAAQPGLVIDHGRFSVNAFALSLSDVPLGAFQIHQFRVAYSQTQDTTTFDIGLSLAFPQRWEVGGRIILVNGDVHEIDMKWLSTGQSTRIAIGTTGLFLTEIDASVQNIDDPSSIQVSGHMIAEMGSTVTMFKEKVTFARMEGDFEVDKDHLKMDAQVWLGADTSGSTTKGVLGTGTGTLLLDWNNQDYELNLHSKMLGGVFTVDAAFHLHQSNQVWVAAGAAVIVPSAIPLIGGKTLASMDFRLAYDPNSVTTSYVAAWVSLDLGFYSVKAGLEYTFDSSSVKTIGNSAINGLEKDPFASSAKVWNYSADLAVPAGATSATFSVNFPTNSGTQAYSLVLPNGNEIQSKDFAANGITPLTSLNTSTSYNLSVVDPKHTTDPSTIPLPSGHYTLKMASTNYQFPALSANIAAILNDGTGKTLVRFNAPPSGLKTGNILAVTGNSVSAYNVEHSVTSVSADGLSVVTDQSFDTNKGQGSGGIAQGWQQPQFDATFYYPPPSVAILDPTPILATPTVTVQLSGAVDSFFTTTTTVDLFLDTEDAGYNGVLLQKSVPMTFQSNGQYSGIGTGDVSNLPTGVYHLYAAINDGTNAPVFSRYSSGFTPLHAVDGLIQNQNRDPQAGWSVYADLNSNGIHDPSEPISQPSTTEGAYHISPDQVRGTLPAPAYFTYDDLSAQPPKVKIVFTSAHNLSIGERLLVAGSANGAYNTEYTVTSVIDSTTVVTDVPFVGNTDGSAATTATLLYQAIPINTPYTLALTNLLPDNFDFAGDGSGTVQNVTFNGTSANQVNFDLNQRATIRGNVFADLLRNGQRTSSPLLFDFGTNTSPVGDGYQQVTRDTTYRRPIGYGWSSGSINAADRGTSNPVTRDFNYTTDGTFLVDLPAAVYDVTLSLGDTGPYVHDDVGVFLQGGQVDTVTTQAGQVITKTYKDITINQGQLILHLVDLGGSDPNAVIESLQIQRHNDPALASWRVQLLDPTGAVTATTLSGPDGSYNFTRVPVGTYQVVLSPSNGEAASYTFETSTDSTIVDDANGPNTHDGTLPDGGQVGTAFQFGIEPRPASTPTNKFLKLDGSTQYVDVLPSNDLTPGRNEFSVSGWIRSDGVNGPQYLAGNLDASDSGGWALQLTSRHDHFGIQSLPTSASGLSDVQVGDFNGDGKPDLVTLNPDSTISIALNTTPAGASTVMFAQAQLVNMGSASYAMAVGDFNGDGFADLAIVYSSANSLKVAVLLNTRIPGSSAVGLTSPQDLPIGPSSGIAIGDLNGDGRVDLVVTNTLQNSKGNNSVSVLLNQTTLGSLTAAFSLADSIVCAQPLSPVIDDFNNDGRPDLAVVSNDRASLSIFFNTTPPNAPAATVTFGTEQLLTPGHNIGIIAVAIGDLNQDGVPDLVLGTVTEGNTSQLSTYINTTTPGATAMSFAAPTSVPLSPNYVNSISIADYTRDAKPDVAISLDDNSVLFLRNVTASGALAASFQLDPTAPTGESPQRITAADFNSDGYIDFVTANLGSASIFVNRSDPAAILSVQFVQNTTEGSGNLSVMDTTPLLPNTWYHVAFTFDPTADDKGDGSRVGTVKFYINGVLSTTATGLGSLPLSPDIAPATDTHFNIGGGGTDSVRNPFSGFVDDFKLWRSMLTPLQVKTLANGAASPSYRRGIEPKSGDYSATIDSEYQVVENLDFGAFESQSVGGEITGNALQTNGFLNPTAQPRAGWNVTLLDDRSKVVATTVSAEDGSYLFTNIATGGYTVEESVPAGWKQTSPLSPTLQFAPQASFSLGYIATAVVAADFDKDGFIDLAFCYNGQSFVRIYWGQASGQFTSTSPMNQYAVPQSKGLVLKALDSHGTGLSDLVLIGGNSDGALVTLLSNQKNAGATRANLFTATNVANWTLQPSTTVQDVAIGDFDRDGRQDLVVAYAWASSSSKINGFAFLPGNQAKATFYNFNAGYPVTGIAAGYVNSDQYLDLIINGGNQPNHLAIAFGDGKGGFPSIQYTPTVNSLTNLPFPAAGFLPPLADINGDGVGDVVYPGVVNGISHIEGIFQDPLSPFPNSTPPSFGVFSGVGYAFRILVADLNGDLRPDMIVLSYESSSQIRYLVNAGDGRTWFSDSVLLGGFGDNAASPDIALADLNGDGLADIVAIGLPDGSSNSTLTTYTNTTTSTPEISILLGSDVASDGNNFLSGQISPIYGSVYDDANSNGLREAHETGLAGVTVYLDVNGNGTYDPGRELSTVTDASGSYAFNQVPEGTYDIRVQTIPGRALTVLGAHPHRVSIQGGLPSQVRADNFGTAPALTVPISSETLLEGATYSVGVDPTAIGMGRKLSFQLEAGAPRPRSSRQTREPSPGRPPAPRARVPTSSRSG